MVAASLAPVQAYSAGAPVWICDRMQPGHGVNPQPTNMFPYDITIEHNRREYSKDTPIHGRFAVS